MPNDKGIEVIVGVGFIALLIGLVSGAVNNSSEGGTKAPELSHECFFNLIDEGANADPRCKKWHQDMKEYNESLLTSKKKEAAK